MAAGCRRVAGGRRWQRQRAQHPGVRPGGPRWRSAATCSIALADISRAAGFVIPGERLPALRERLEAIARRELDGADLQPAIDIDAHVRISSLMGDNFRFLQSLAPYGEANPKPVFLTKGVKARDAQPVGAQGNHLRLKLQHEGVVWDAIAFGRGGDWSVESDVLDIVYTLSVDTWGKSRTLKLIVEDFRASSGD